jgi:hypothetical protein
MGTGEVNKGFGEENLLEKPYIGPTRCNWVIISNINNHEAAHTVQRFLMMGEERPKLVERLTFF